MKKTFFPSLPLIAMVLCGSMVHQAPAQDASDKPQPSASAATQREIVQRGLAYLRAQGESSNGVYSPETGTGVTSLVATAMLRNGVPTSDPALAKSLEHLADSARDDGGIYADGSRLKNYETCVAILCLDQANSDGRYDAILKRAMAYVRGVQWDEGEGVESSDPTYGGSGYGGDSRPDLSNTAFVIDALRTVDSPENDAAIERALKFVSRCQNLESEHNQTASSAKINDGGFYYTVAAGGVSSAGQSPDGGLRSYGSMTYAGLKSMLYAGLTPEDPRVKAAMDWIGQHYTLESNPGMGDAGLFYYYNLFAKALDVSDVKQIEDAQGVEHNWRAELVAELGRRQSPDGSWVNETTRWFEGDRNLVTAYCLLALSHCADPAPAAE